LKISLFFSCIALDKEETLSKDMKISAKRKKNKEKIADSFQF